MVMVEPARGSFAYIEQPGLLSLSGLDQFRPFLERQVPAPPLYHLSGLVVEEVGLGTATFSMPASPWWRSAAGVFLAGVFPFVADAALGSAIYTALPAKRVLATSELSMNYLRPAGVRSGRLIARSKLIQVGKALGLSEATVEDASGLLLAHATSRCVLIDLGVEPPPAPEAFPPVEWPAEEPPDPHLRPLDGEAPPEDYRTRASGLEMARAWIDGFLALPPVCRFTGLRIVDAEEGRSVWTMPASPWFCSSYGTFYGGALAMLADVAAVGALETTLPAGTTCGPLDQKVNFLRRVTPDGRPLTAKAEVVHRGRTIAVISVQVEDPEGGTVAMATETAMILTGWSWHRALRAAAIDQAPADAGN